jgi:hypothetical protein
MGDLAAPLISLSILPRSSRLTLDAIGIESGETNRTLSSLATIARTLKVMTSRRLEGLV